MKTIYPYNENLTRSTPIQVPDDVYVVFDQQSKVIKVFEKLNSALAATIEKQTAEIKELRKHVWRERIVSYFIGALSSATIAIIICILETS